MAGEDPTPSAEQTFNDRVAQLMQAMTDAGYPVRVVSSRRTADQQGKLYAKGRTAPGSIVTEKSGQPGDESKHQSGLATDFGFIGPDGVNQAEHNPWKLLGQKAREVGLEWGGDWTSLNDRPHVQLSYKDMPVPQGAQVDAGHTSGVKVTEPGQTTAAPAPVPPAPQVAKTSMPDPKRPAAVTVPDDRQFTSNVKVTNAPAAEAPMPTTAQIGPVRSAISAQQDPKPDVRRHPVTGQLMVVHADGSAPTPFSDLGTHDHSAWNDSNTQDSFEMLKQLLTTGGTVGGGLLAGPPGAIVGGAIGRDLGHVPEALHTAATGKPNQGGFLEDSALGALEGGAQEVAPIVGGPILKYGGRGLKALVSPFSDNMMVRAAAGSLPAALAGLLEGGNLHAFGFGGAGSALGIASKPVAESIGGAAERLGSKIEGKPLSTLIREWFGGGAKAEEAYPRYREGPSTMNPPTEVAEPEPTATYREGPSTMNPPTAAPEPDSNATGSVHWNEPKPPASVRVLERKDEMWGPGSVDKSGSVAQADVGRANLKYDPQTPTSYLREQLSQETDPAAREFLAKVIDQRRRIEAAATGIKP